MEPMKGKWVSSRVYLWYTELFCIPEVTSVFFSSVTVFFGTLWCPVRQIEAPYVFDCEYGIPLHAMHGIQGSSPGEGDGSWDFSSCGFNLGYILELQRKWPYEPPLGSAMSGLLSAYDGHLRNLN